MTAKNGFSLVELLLVVAVIGLLTALSLPVYQTFQVKNDLAVATTTVGQSLRRAQLLAQAVADDNTWGVMIQSGSIVLFQGTSYSARDTTEDEIFTLPASITPTGQTEIVFNKLTGLPQTTGTTTLTTSTNETATIAINNQGTVTY